MYYCKPSYIIFRNCLDFGYLTDNRNFGYDTASKSCLKVGDRILSKTGSVFYSVLTEKPQSVYDLSNQLSRLFIGVSRDEIENDAREFYNELSRDGFIISCESKALMLSASIFSYENRVPLVMERGKVETGEGSLDLNWGTMYHLNRVHVDVSGLCNEHCVHCYIPDSYRRLTMHKDLFQEIIAQCTACNVLNITISGGEPMLNPYLPDFIKLCEKYNYSINVLTNLTLLTDELLYLFKNTPLLSVQTSLYSLNAEIHDEITGVRGSFAKTKKAIETLREHNVPMQINCPIMRLNKDSYKDVLDWAKSLNIESNSDYMLFGCFDGSQKNIKSRLTLSEVEAIIRCQKDDNVDANHSNQIEGDIGRICPVCTNSLCISHTGNVYPCKGWQEFVLGNVQRESLAEIWDNSARVTELRNLSYDDFPKCLSCEDKEYCSLCLIRNANESISNDYKETNPYFCSIARFMRLYSEDEIS